MKKIYIGNTPDGVPVVMDIAQMPHLLRRLRRLSARFSANLATVAARFKSRLISASLANSHLD